MVTAVRFTQGRRRAVLRSVGVFKSYWMMKRCRRCRHLLSNARSSVRTVASSRRERSGCTRLAPLRLRSAARSRRRHHPLHCATRAEHALFAIAALRYRPIRLALHALGIDTGVDVLGTGVGAEEDGHQDESCTRRHGHDVPVSFGDDAAMVAKVRGHPPQWDYFGGVYGSGVPMATSGCFFVLASNAVIILSIGPTTQESTVGLSSISTVASAAPLDRIGDSLKQAGPLEQRGARGGTGRAQGSGAKPSTASEA